MPELTSTITCVGLLFVYQCEVPKPVPVDSYCTSYQRVFRQKGDATISAPLAVKQRIAANDVIYRCTCEHWDSPLCQTVGSPPAK